MLILAERGDGADFLRFGHRVFVPKKVAALPTLTRSMNFEFKRRREVSFSLSDWPRRPPRLATLDLLWMRDLCRASVSFAAPNDADDRPRHAKLGFKRGNGSAHLVAAAVSHRFALI
jgi:hypothetical protein